MRLLSFRGVELLWARPVHMRCPIALGVTGVPWRPVRWERSTPLLCCYRQSSAHRRKEDAIRERERERELFDTVSASFGSIYLSNARMVRRVLGARVPCTEVEDLSQAVWLVVLEKWDQISPRVDEDKARFLRATAVLVARNWSRHCKRSDRMLRALKSDHKSIGQDELEEPDLLLGQKNCAHVRVAMQCLEPADRRLLEQHYYEGKPYSEIADSESVCPATVRKRASRAVQTLSKGWTDSGPETLPSSFM